MGKRVRNLDIVEGVVMSQLAKAALIIITLNIFLYLGIPEARLGGDVVSLFLNIRDQDVEVGSGINATLGNITKSETGIVGTILAMPDYVQKAIGFVVLIAGIISSPITVGNYLAGQGAPIAAIILYAGVCIAVYGLAIMDWLRSGS